MYVIVVGCGKVGYFLTKALSVAGHEIAVIEVDARRCEKANEELGNICLGGDGSEPHVLEEVGAGRSDVLIAVTGLDEDNLTACQLAKHRFNISRTIALVNNPQNDPLFKLLGVDVTVSNIDVVLNHIEEELPAHPLIHVTPLRGGGHREIVEIKIPPDAACVGGFLSELQLPPGSHVSLVINSDGRTQLPHDDPKLQANDEVVVVTIPDAEDALCDVLTRPE